MKRDYYVYPISLKKAQEVSVQFHYLHRPAPCSQAFGLVANDSFLCGIVMYGTPSNRNLRSGICGKDEARNVIELVRLWIEDGTPKNAESFLIGYTIPKVKKEIIVSYADPTFGHIGTVYQATNWLYTGLSEAKHSSYAVDGIACHKQTLFDSLGRARKTMEGQGSLFGPLEPERGYQVKKLIEKYGDSVTVGGQQIGKHRYVYFNAAKARKAELMAKLRYPVLPYPKRTGVEGMAL